LKVLVVFSHPRRDSFCGAALDNFTAGLAEAGHVFEIADLHAEKFDPVMPLADEPDWNDDNKRYSDDVLREQARIARHDGLAFVFPVWWWSMPAMLKGWIDRVWNNGWAYGSRKLPHRRALLLATAVGTEESYRTREYDKAMRIQLIVGTMNFCGIADARLHLLCDVLSGPEPRRRLLAEAKDLGRQFAEGAPPEAMA
jgi:NAD(P)H dehydrogenase (quinone)